MTEEKPKRVAIHPRDGDLLAAVLDDYSVVIGEPKLVGWTDEAPGYTVFLIVDDDGHDAYKSRYVTFMRGGHNDDGSEYSVNMTISGDADKQFIEVAESLLTASLSLIHTAIEVEEEMERREKEGRSGDLKK